MHEQYRNIRGVDCTMNEMCILYLGRTDFFFFKAKQFVKRISTEEGVHEIQMVATPSESPFMFARVNLLQT